MFNKSDYPPQKKSKFSGRSEKVQEFDRSVASSVESFIMSNMLNGKSLDLEFEDAAEVMIINLVATLAALSESVERISSITEETIDELPVSDYLKNELKKSMFKKGKK